MATIGVESLEVWILDENLEYDDSQKATRHFKIDGSKTASGVINVKVDGLSSSPNPVFASNKPVYTSFGSPSPKAEVELLDIPIEMQAALLGQEVTNGVMSISSEAKNPYVAIELVGNDIKGGKQHVAFPKAIASLGGEEMKTKEEKGADPKGQSITFTAMADANGEMVYKGYDKAESWQYQTGFQDKWLKKKEV